MANIVSRAGLSILSGPPYTPLVLRLAGDLDMGSTSQVRCSLLAGLLDARDVIVDMSELAFCDCSGVRLFLELSSVDGTRLRLAAPRGAVRRVLSVLGVGDTAEIYASVDSALRGDAADRICGLSEP